MAITRATNLADIGSGIGANPSQTIGIGPGIQMDGSSTGIITATTFSGTATNAGTAVNLGIGATGYGLVLSADLTAANVTVGGTLTYDDVTNIDSIGIITARSGVSIGDSIFHTGDSNTAIRFPAADTFSVETAGSERLRITSGGSAEFAGAVSMSSDLTVDSGTLFVDATNNEVGIGTVLPGNALHVYKTGDGQTPVLFETGNATGKLRFYNDSNGWSIDSDGELRFVGGRTGSGAPVSLHIKSSGAATFTAGLAEKYENAGTTLGAQTNNPLSDGNVILFAGNESGNNTINFTGVHATLSNGETVSFTAIITPNNSGYIGTVQVDGVAPATAVYWSGGAPTSGGASGKDIYTFTILKTGSGTNAYQIYGAVTNYTNA